MSPRHLPNTMEHATMTRSMLQRLNRHQDHFEELNAIQQRIHYLVSFIVWNVLRTAESGKTRYVYDSNAMTEEKLSPIAYVRTEHYRCYKVVNVLSDVISQLEKQFPDCDILSNPLQTYIIVDWS